MKNALLLVTSIFQIISVGAYPSYWVASEPDVFKPLKPGGPFGHMGIDRFEEANGDACRVSCGVPVEGYAPSTDYIITMSSSVPVGVVLKTTSGQFQSADFRSQRGVCTRHGRGVHITNQTWTWKSPADTSEVTIYAVCATDFAGKAFVAQSVKLKMKIHPVLVPFTSINTSTNYV
eukprot:TRINITY_DN11486_c0_g1_i3.p1 TRINITY_DN11486_c0_g1~~TRINITY_DN11486_c0_g1_i3.p1  ORF type:complete len:202 (+),score=18.14 TRINITY_DN11486_c0_g1_i3:80-607(+)